MLVKLNFHNDEEVTEGILFELKTIREPQSRTIIAPAVIKGVEGAEEGKSYYIAHITLDMHEGRVITIFDLNRLGS